MELHSIGGFVYQNIGYRTKHTDIFKRHMGTTVKLRGNTGVGSNYFNVLTSVTNRNHNLVR